MKLSRKKSLLQNTRTANLIKPVNITTGNNGKLSASADKGWKTTSGKINTFTATKLSCMKVYKMRKSADGWCDAGFSGNDQFRADWSGSSDESWTEAGLAPASVGDITSSPDIPEDKRSFFLVQL